MNVSGILVHNISDWELRMIAWNLEEASYEHEVTRLHLPPIKSGRLPLTRRQLPKHAAIVVREHNLRALELWVQIQEKSLKRFLHPYTNHTPLVVGSNARKVNGCDWRGIRTKFAPEPQRSFPVNQGDNSTILYGD